VHTSGPAERDCIPEAGAPRSPRTERWLVVVVVVVGEPLHRAALISLQIMLTYYSRRRSRRGAEHRAVRLRPTATDRRLRCNARIPVFRRVLLLRLLLFPVTDRGPRFVLKTICTCSITRCPPRVSQM